MSTREEELQNYFLLLGASANSAADHLDTLRKVLEEEEKA